MSLNGARRNKILKYTSQLSSLQTDKQSKKSVAKNVVLKLELPPQQRFYTFCLTLSLHHCFGIVSVSR